MTAQADQFRSAFEQEALEILGNLEAALLQLNEAPGDPELIASVFRGLHTLKGSGAMFGYDQLAAFAHQLENAYEAVRSGSLAVTSDLIDLTLSGLDQIKLLFDEVSDRDSVERASLLQRLAQLTKPGSKQTAQEEHAHPERIAPGSPIEPAGAERRWKISFTPGEDLVRSGNNPLLLLRDLRNLGKLCAVARMESIPSLANLDPNRCYVAWELTLDTRASSNEIRDVFIFVEDRCELVIEAVENSPAAEADITARGLMERRGSRGGRRDHDGPDNANSIRVAAAKLDLLVNLVGELVTVQARLSEIAGRREDPEVISVAEEVERLAAALRENSMDMRMMPIRGTFEKFRRLVHDLARDLHKQVELTIEGGETELDKSVIDQLSDPLMHLIRNSMDHGIGEPEERLAHGKPPQASIHLCARHSGASVLISVSDDGRGIDADAVRSRAVERGLISADAKLTKSEVYALILQPGFSTAKQVTDLSGRGVGMDVVRRNIDKLRGSIDISSEPGAGTTVTLRLPLTLAIIDGLLVTVGRTHFVLPLANTLECIEISREEVDSAQGNRLINVRGEAVPYIRLRDHFEISDALTAFEQVILVDTGDGRYGLVVDTVLGNCQTMIKSLGRVYSHVHTVSGATILGNGTVALIVDPPRLIEECIRVQPSVRGHP